MEENIENIPIFEFNTRYGMDLPGLRPIDYVPPSRSGLRRKLFIHALSTDDHSENYYRDSYEEDSCEENSREGRLTPMRELQMMRWMNIVTDKENWDVKVTMSRLLMGKGRQCSE